MREARTYLLLVVVPLLLLVPLLRAGRTLVAPPSVAGEWRAADGTVLRLVRSGTRVEATLIQGAARRGFRARLNPADPTGALVIGPGAGVRLRLLPASRPTAAELTMGGRRDTLTRAPR